MFINNHFADGMPIVCGGYSYPTYYDACYKYSPFTDSWQEYGTMPSSRAYSAPAYLEDFGLVMAGGLGGDLNSGFDYLDSVIVTKDGNTFDIFDSLPNPNYKACLAAVDEQILLTGGVRFDGEFGNTEYSVYSYNVAIDTWTRYLAKNMLL